MGGREGSITTATKIITFPASVTKWTIKKIRKRKTRRQNSSEKPSRRNSMVASVLSLSLSMQPSHGIYRERNRREIVEFDLMPGNQLHEGKNVAIV